MSGLNKFNVDKMCRTCRSFRGMKSLYDYFISDVCLAEMLTLCTPVKYCSEDELPQQICENCLIEVIRSYKFALKCKESNEMFRKHKTNVNITFSPEIAKNNDCVNKDIYGNITKEIEFVHCPDNTSELCEQKYTQDALSTQIKQEHFPDGNIKLEVKSEMMPIGTINNAFAQHYLHNRTESMHESDDSIDIDNVKIEDSECYKKKSCNETEYSTECGNSAMEHNFRQQNCALMDNKSRGVTNPSNPTIPYPKWVDDGILQIISIDPDEVCKNKEDKVSDASDTEESGQNATISKDSKAKYDLAYEQFEKWCAEHQIVEINEKVLLDYFEGKKTLKASTLWTHYSMLRMELSLRRNIDIKKYTNLLAFLKRQQDGYHAKKSNVLSKENISKFLIEADDTTFLMAKVAMIIGIAGACRKAELTYLRVEDVIDAQTHFRVNISNPKTKREFPITMGNFDGIQFVEIIRKYINLRPPKVKHNRFFIKYSDGKCGVLPVGINTFGNLPKTIAQSIGLPNPVLFTGHCFRRSSVTLLAGSGAALLKIKRKGYIDNSIEKKKKC